MSYTGSNLCNQAATQLPVCDTCKGDTMIYPLLKKDCYKCNGKSSVACTECGGCGYVRIIEPTKCENCQGTGRMTHIVMVRESSSS
jgi:DnaJ-class molecular chaperone